jgi:hypothetical protein
MKKKTISLFSVAACVLLLASYTVYKTSGAHPGSTGAPGDLTCAQSGCHVTASVLQDSGLVNTLLFTSNDTTYTPGNSYTLTLQVTKPQISKFGFELVALKDSTNKNIGNFTLLEGTRTQKINHMAGGGDLRFSMTHKTAGTSTSSPGAIQWKMKWTAPTTNVGTITFWYASNCTNNNGQNTGDQVFLSHFQIRPYVPEDTTGGNDTTITTGMKKINPDLNRLRAYQESNSHFLSVNFSSYTEQEGKIMLCDVSGRLLLAEPIRFVPGHNMQRLELPANCCEGAYFVKVVADNRVYTNKIILEK